MDAGCSFVAGGSWEAPSEEFADGRLVSSNGLVSAIRTEEGFVNLTLLYPVDSRNVACVATRRGGGTDSRFLAIDQTSDAVKTVIGSNGDDAADISFDFIFIRFAQPTQG